MILQSATATPFGDAIANFTNGSVQNTGPYLPDVNWQSSGHIKGWIDVVGFNEMTFENDTYYVPDNPADYAIVLNDAVGVFQCSICGYTITKTIGANTQGMYTVANMDIKMVWYELVCTKNGCSCVQHIEYTSFNDVEKSPENYNLTTKRPLNATVTFYNNSYRAKTVINPEKNLRTISERYEYNQSIVHISKIGSIEKTAKGVKYVAFYPANIWKNGNASVLSTMNDSVVITGSNFSMSNLTVKAIYLYDITINSSVLNYAEINYDPYNTFHPLFYFVSFLVLIPIWVTVNITKRFKI